MKKFKKIISVICLVALITTCSATAVFAETLHKINGAGTTTGGVLEYQSTISMPCNKIRAQGDCVIPYQYATAVVQDQNGIKVADATIPLDNAYHDVAVGNFPKGTYTITVTPMFYAEYGVSTFFYY